ncbi:TetR/AcrR family transcriptional regulator [Leucobacter luti]|uniref:TetR/AcrR family transcriptional regulator n=1 Tax=Leucobacter luti TaxID=340320 RepID=UPI001C68AD82|nr:TetR/AcrR family transcriptional regulator [Leucobacter luti]QYM75747.1 TetR/AcrR family transcriptional regulator [Leucobacter luti]
MAEDTRERILTSCAAVIARSGLAKFRMIDVARDAEVSIGLLAYHFGDRDGLLQSALDEVTASATRRAASVPEAHTPAGQLAALLCSEFGDEPGIRAGSTAWNELRAAAVFDTERAGAVARSTGHWQRQVETLIAAADPEREAAAVAAAALALTALVEGLSGRWLTGQVTAAEAQSAVRGALTSLELAPTTA